MKDISDLQIGKAGEYLVCADLILNGLIAFPSEQGLPFDVVLQHNNKLFKIQVKTTRGPKHIPQRKTDIPAYVFHIGSNGKNNRRKQYNKEQVDIFALVCLDTKSVGYIAHKNVRSTMNFRVPELRGEYHDEQGLKIKEDILTLRRQGYSCKEISGLRQMALSNVYKYSANVSLEQKGTNAGIYFDTLTLQKCLNEL